MRSSTLIALLGVGLLVVAVGAAVLRGTEDETPTALPATENTATEAPSATDSTDEPSPQDTPSASVTASDTATPTETTTATETASPDATAAPSGEQTTEPTDGRASEPVDGDQADTDDGIALGPTDVEDTPQTGGGALSVLGAAVAGSAVVVGRRQHG